jgi:hypothetical protein
VSAEGRVISNVPILAGTAAAPIRVPDAGDYELSCENHATESASLVVVDHRWATTTDELGRFTLRDVPAGDRTVVVRTHARKPITRIVRVSSQHTLDVSIEIGGESTP